MIRVSQRVVGDPRRHDGAALDGTPGDCLRACVASLLDLDYDEVPPFAQYGTQWWDVMRRWARARGDDFCAADISAHPRPLAVRHLFAVEPDYLIASGPSPRGRYRHAILTTASLAYVWDPHPSRVGLGTVDEIIMLVAPYSPEDIDAMPALEATR